MLEHQTRVSGPPSFGDILSDGVNLVLRRRALSPLTASALDDVARGEPFRCSAEVAVNDPDVDPLLTEVRGAAARAFLAKDIRAIVTAFGQLLARRHVHARLTLVEDDACRKLHTDNVTIRLICTYAGPATEWVRDADVLRENLCRIDVDVDTANRSILRRPDALQRAQPGDVLLLKGEARSRRRPPLTPHPRPWPASPRARPRRARMRRPHGNAGIVRRVHDSLGRESACADEPTTPLASPVTSAYRLCDACPSHDRLPDRARRRRVHSDIGGARTGRGRSGFGTPSSRSRLGTWSTPSVASSPATPWTVPPDLLADGGLQPGVDGLLRRAAGGGSPAGHHLGERRVVRAPVSLCASGAQPFCVASSCAGRQRAADLHRA